MVNSIPTLENLKNQRVPVRNVNIEYHEKISRLEKVALYITEKVGTMGFFLVVSIWTLGWLAWNTFGPDGLRFDPFPAFVLWLFISNVIQLVFLPLIMVGQNLQGRHAEARAQSDFEVNVKAEREIGAILLRLEEQSKMILQILKHLENKRNESR